MCFNFYEKFVTCKKFLVAKGKHPVPPHSKNHNYGLL